MAQSLLRKCDICEESSGIYFCYECQQVLCKPCRTSHGKIQATKSHSITESSTVDRAILSSGVSCKSHDKDFVLFCEKCTCLVCPVCIASAHNGHSFHEIEEAANNKRKVIQQMVTSLKAKINNISCSIEDVKSQKQPQIKESCEQYVGNIRDLTLEFHNMIDFVSETNINEATDFSAIELQQLELDLSKLQKTYNEYTETSKNLEQSLNQKHDITFLVAEQSLRSQFESLSEVPSVKEPEQFKDFDKVEFTSKIIDHIRLKYSIRIIEDKEKTIQMLQEELKKEKAKHSEKEMKGDEINAKKEITKELNCSASANISNGSEDEEYTKWLALFRCYFYDTDNGIIEEKEEEIQMLQEELQTENVIHESTKRDTEFHINDLRYKIRRETSRTLMGRRNSLMGSRTGRRKNDEEIAILKENLQQEVIRHVKSVAEKEAKINRLKQEIEELKIHLLLQN